MQQQRKYDIRALAANPSRNNGALRGRINAVKSYLFIFLKMNVEVNVQMKEYMLQDNKILLLVQCSRAHQLVFEEPDE